jgi:hypothetical protein
MISNFYWYLKSQILFMFSILISTFETTDFLHDSILSKKINVDLMKKHRFYYVSIVFYLFDIITII